jgi:hypothetical protein
LKKSLEKQQEGLPAGLKKTEKCTHELELWADLEELDVTDLHIVLNTEGFTVWREMPDQEHKWAVQEIEIEFDEWKEGKGVLGTAKNPTSLWITATLDLPK